MTSTLNTPTGNIFGERPTCERGPERRGQQTDGLKNKRKHRKMAYVISHKFTFSQCSSHRPGVFEQCSPLCRLFLHSRRMFRPTSRLSVTRNSFPSRREQKKTLDNSWLFSCDQILLCVCVRAEKSKFGASIPCSLVELKSHRRLT